LVKDGIIAEMEDVVASGPGRGRTELGCRLLWTVDEEKKKETKERRRRRMETWSIIRRGEK
jgi:hypothetical protein